MTSELIGLARELASRLVEPAALDLALRLTAVTAAGLLVLAAARRASAAVRHRIAVLALGAALALPAAALLLPAFPLPVLPARPEALARFGAAERARTSDVVPRERREGAASPASPAPAFSRFDVLAAEEAAAGPAPSSRSLTARVRAAAVGAFASALLMLLLGVPLLLLTRLARSLVAAGRLAARATEVSDVPLRFAFFSACDALAIGRTVSLRETGELAVPAVFGLRRPVLLLPLGAADWPAERVRTVLLHELAHVARGDGHALLLTRFATSVLWFHPFVHALARQARLACEQACDDVVLAQGPRATDYAGDLVAIASAAQSDHAIWSVAPAFARRSTLERRVAAILEPHASRRPVSRGAAGVLTALAALALVAFACVRVVEARPKPAPEARTSLRPDAGAVRFSDTDAAVPFDETAVPAPDPLAIPAASPGAAELAAERAADAPDPAAPVSAANVPDVPDATPAIATEAPATAEFASGEGGDLGKRWYGRAKDLYEARKWAESAKAYVYAATAGYRVTTAWYNAACSFALAGEKTRALDAIAKALDAGFDGDGYLSTDDDLDALRGEPRFAALVERARHTGSAEARRLSALDTYRRLRAGPSTDDDAWQSAGLDLLHAGEYSEAVAAFTAQYTLDSTAAALYNQACAWARAGKSSNALDALQRSLEAGFGDPRKLRTDDDLESLRRQQRFDDLVDLAGELELGTGFGNWDTKQGWRNAMKRYERAASRHPELGRAWSNLGYARLRADDPRGAAEAWSRALDRGYRIGTSSYNMACAYAQQRRTDEALRWLELAEARGFDVASSARHDDDLDPIRSDTHFRRMLARWNERIAEKKEKDGK